MPGQCQLSVDTLVDECRRVHDLGIPAVLLFGIPERKDAFGSQAYADDGIVQQAARAVKQSCPELVVVTDVCLCEYTDHGHCGVITARLHPSSEPASLKPVSSSGFTEAGSGASKDVDNDATLPLLVQEAVSHARAGADMVAPSDMMDGRVAAIRSGLDEAGFTQVPIMAYAAKFASSYYGPFRDAAESPPQFGDRRSYQMDFANANEALREVAADIEEGADIVLVKPATPYLDIVWRVKERFGVPVAAYQVSGEYAAIKAAAANGWIDEKGAVLEATTAIARAGADLIITYYARELARWTHE